MNPTLHFQKAQRIERSLAKLPAHLVEIRIEAAMLAATHWLNASLHALHATGESTDVLHTYMLTVNEFRRLSAAHQALMEMVAEIEDLRPVNVRGDTPGAEAAAERACELLARVRVMAQAICAQVHSG